MNTFQNVPANSNKSLRLLGWVLGILFILKSLDFFLSINLSTESELSPVILEAVLFSISGVAMLLLALGTIRLARWVRTPLYLVFVSNLLFLIYSTLLVPNWLDASISLIGAVVLFFYLKKSRRLVTGRRLIGLQILTLLTLLPATIFLLLSVVFTDQALLDDSAMRLPMVEPTNDSDNLYITLTNLGDELPSASGTVEELVSEYPSSWDQATANQIVRQLQPHIDAYVSGTNQVYQCPTSVNNFATDAELCELNLLRDYAQVMQFAALYEARRGNSVLAQTYATAPITVGLTILESKNVTLIEYLVGLASVNIGLDTLETLMKENILSQTDIKQQLTGISIPTDSLRTPMQREYLGMRLALEDNLDLPQNYFYHPNRTRNELYTFMAKVANLSTTSCSTDNTTSSTETELVKYVEKVQSNAFNPTRPNMIGNMYLSVVIASLSGIKNNVCEANERINTLAN
jgi:hypothetical protein